jgi:hypothetical protein
VGDLYCLDTSLGVPLADAGAFCLRCVTKYDRENWLAWFRQHRPEVVSEWEGK